MTPEETQKSIESIQASIESLWIAAERNQKFSTEQILKLQDQITWKLSLEASAADQRMEAFARLNTTQASIDLMTSAFNRAIDAFNLVRQQRDEINAATDERERGWIHEHKLALEAHAKALIELHVVVSQALGKVKRPKSDSNGNGKEKKGDELKAAEKLSEQTADAAEKTVAAVRRLEEVSTTIATQRREEDEERHTPWYARIPAAFFAALFKAKPLTQLIVLLMFITFAVSGYVFLRLYQHADETREPEKHYRWERNRSGPVISPAPTQ